jgi:hypothetical protein
MTFIRAVVLVGGFALALTSGMALAAGVAPTPTALDGTAILPDPALNRAHALPAGVATQGIATVSAAQNGPLINCSRSNPCAMVTPARDSVTISAGQSANRAAAVKHRDENDAAAAKGGAGDLRS